MTDYDATRQDITVVHDPRVILASLTNLQLQWINARIGAKTDAEACETIGIDKLTSARWENKSDIDLVVKTLLIDRCLVAGEYLTRLSLDAAREIEAQLHAQSAAARRWAAEQALDRSLGKPVARIVAHVNDPNYHQYDDLIHRVYNDSEAAELDLLESGE